MGSVLIIEHMVLIDTREYSHGLKLSPIPVEKKNKLQSGDI
jgi:hypothetical protein